MSWEDIEIAGPMGYEHCVLFDCARDALRAYPHGVSLPGNICPSVYKARPDATLEEVVQTTGLAKYSPTHLYGYQSPAGEHFALALDPLMTGWVRRLKTESAIISFGLKKMLSIGYGGAFLTNNRGLAEVMEEKGHWNEAYADPLLTALNNFYDNNCCRWKIVGLWDRYLGDSLIRIPGEQLMPWRVIRRATDVDQRDAIVRALRAQGHDVGTNYQALEGSNEWGDTVLNFFCGPDIEKAEIQHACRVIKRVVNDE